MHRRTAASCIARATNSGLNSSIHRKLLHASCEQTSRIVEDWLRHMLEPDLMSAL